MDEDVTKFTLRLPNDIRDVLLKRAAEEDRSLHNLIIKILRDAASK